MSEFFSKDWSGDPFVLFGPAHLTALGIILLINLLLPLLRGRTNEQQRKYIRYGLAALLVIDEAGWHYWNWSTGQWSIQTTLPLHLCSVMVFLSAIMLVTRNYRLYEYLYFLGIGAATQALLTPDAGMYGFPHFRAFQVMVSHGCIVTAAVYMTVVEGYRPHLVSLKRVFIGANIYMAVVGVINYLIGSNYLFIARKPDTASLIDMLGPWPWYILSMELVGLVVGLLLYTPFAVADWKVRRERVAAAG